MKPVPLLVLLLLAGLRLTRGAEATPSAPPPVQSAPVAPTKPGEAVSLRPGEAFTFQVGWGLFSGAGEVKVAASTATSESGRPTTRVITQTATKGVIGAFYSFTGEAIADFDAADGLLLNARANTRAGKKETRMSVVFDYPRSEASYVDPLRPARTRLLAMPPGRPMDLITVLIQARAWNLQPGEAHPALVLFDDDFYPLKITAQHVERISTPKGKRDAMLLTPEVDGAPKGMFRKGGAISVWISNDADRLPLKFEVKVKVGTAVATLVDYQPPTPVVPPKETEKKVTAQP
jgi:hypothetical protein